MFDTDYRPLPHVMGIYCDYRHLMYGFRQKVKEFQSKLLDLQQLSHCMYKLLLFDDGCVLYDPIRNKVICSTDYSRNMVVLRFHLSALKRLYEYEEDNNNIKNQIDFNDYQSLKKKYYE